MEDNIYLVTVAKYANIYVAAESENDIKRIVDRSYIPDELFEDSEVEADLYEPGAYDLEYIKDEYPKETIFFIREDGEADTLKAKEYWKQWSELREWEDTDTVENLKRKAVYQPEETIIFDE